MAAGSHPRDSCISGIGDAGVIPAAGCFQWAVMGSLGPLFPFPSSGAVAKGSGSWWRLGSRGQHPTPASSPQQPCCELPQCGVEGAGETIRP